MHQPATRSAAKRILGELTPSAQKSLALTLICLIIAVAFAFGPTHEGLASEGVLALFILVFCAALWVTEAMPAFAVSLLAIGLSIVLVGHDEQGAADWEKYIATWGSPLIWLFFGGFILAAAAKKTGLDLWMAAHVLSRLGKRPAFVLMGLMASTALLSMFLSNTATATMMVAMLGPMLSKRQDHSKHAKPLLLGVAMAANIGGMGTLIGTPPNAIAAGALEDVGGVNFAQWMFYGIPPALLLLSLAWSYLLLRHYRDNAFSVDDKLLLSAIEPPTSVPRIQQGLVVVTFAATNHVVDGEPLARDSHHRSFVYSDLLTDGDSHARRRRLEGYLLGRAVTDCRRIVVRLGSE